MKINSLIIIHFHLTIMRLLIIQILLFIVTCMIIYFIFSSKSHSIRERLDLETVAPGGGKPKSFYGRPGIPSVPLDIPIPKQPIRTRGDGTFVDYSNDVKQMCPSKPGTHCNTVLDCGPAELCIDQAGWIVSDHPDMVQPESAVCVCSIQNACVSGENIC